MDSRQTYVVLPKELFTNPVKKIKLSPFLEAGFSEKTLDIVIRKFTDWNKKKISIRMLQEFIKGFCKPNEQLYLDFLLSNFRNDFMEIFLTDIEPDIVQFTNKQASKLFNRFSQREQAITAEGLTRVANQLGLKMDLKEARDIVKYCSRTKESVDKYDFLKIVKAFPTQ